MTIETEGQPPVACERDIRIFPWEGMVKKMNPTMKNQVKVEKMKEGNHHCSICCEYVEDVFRDLEIHHNDGNPENNVYENLRLAHHSCNARLQRHRTALRERLKAAGCLHPPYRERDKAKATRIHPSRADGFAPRKNAEAEPLFRRWVFAVVKSNREEPKTRDYFIDNGAALVGANPQTIARYMDKLCADTYGCLDDSGKNRAGQTVAVFRTADDYDLTVEELESRYPWQGLRFSELFLNPEAKPPSELKEAQA